MNRKRGQESRYRYFSWYRSAIILSVMTLWGCGKWQKHDGAMPSEWKIYDEADFLEGISQYYGYYKISQFWPYDDYDALKYDRLPLEEADMMLGRIVEIQENMLLTCDSFRSLGSRGGREAFTRNYTIEMIAIESPCYEWEEFTPDTAWYEAFSEKYYYMEKPEDGIKENIAEQYYQGIEGKISVRVAGPIAGYYGDYEYYHEYYVKEDGMIMHSGLTENCFYLEKLDGRPDESVRDQNMTEEEKEAVLQSVLGIYTITEFLPTKFYPGLDSAGDEHLPKEEAYMMLGKEIIMESDLYGTYDNGRWPNSEFRNRKMDEFILSRIEIKKPEYRIEERCRDDIYGLRDDMLPEGMVQDTYLEIKVYPGFSTYPDSTSAQDREQPQLYLLDDGRLIMYAMSEYFLLEKQGQKFCLEQPYFCKWQEDDITGIKAGYENENLTQEDIQNIAQLHNLKQLDICIGDSQLDLSLLGNLKGLETLTIHIQGNGDIDLSFLKELARLTKLEISAGSNTDLSPLGSLTGLKQLSISGGDDNDLSFLRNLKQLEDLILIKWCIVEDLSFFKNMVCLRSLYVTYVGDVDLNELTELKMLEELTIVGEHIRNLEGLSNLSHLRLLSLEDNSAEAIYAEAERPVLDLEPLEKLTELNVLFFGYIRLEDLSPLAVLPNLYSIGLIKTDVDNLLPLKELENLRELVVYGNTSNQVQEQAEVYFREIEHLTVTDELPY